MPKTSTSATSDLARIRRTVMRWYRENGRHELPWRLTRDPYAVLVSEVMLQQTQVDRVLPYFDEWMQRWPNLASLAAAPASEVIRAWRGLGYNRRALNLHRLAVITANQHDGTLPEDEKTLRKLPGIGEYTAAAVSCFAREERVLVADTNIARVVARVVLGAASQKDVLASELRHALASLLPPHSARDHNLALMDLGALVCSARSPNCDVCPLSELCRWRRDGFTQSTTASLPTPKFETTARFARGRIVEALREAPATTEELRDLLPKTHRPLIAGYLAGLARDGLAQETSGIWTLPAE